MGYCSEIVLFINIDIFKPQSEYKNKMTDKTKLIQSMTNLIQHVSSNRKNQEQIFATLSAADLRKILSNLEDTNEKLRKITLLLLAQLLYQNSGLQRKFCQLTGLPYYPGKVVLTHNFPKTILNDSQALIQVFKLLKDDSNQKQRGLFWYIDSQSKPKMLQVGRRNSFVIDPLNTILGIWLQDEDLTNSKNNNQSNNLANIQNFGISKTVVNKSYQNTYVETPQRHEVKTVINPTNGKVRLNRSEQLQKSYQFNFKPQTPLKSSLNSDQHSSINKPRDNSFNAWVPSTPLQFKSQIKSFSQTEPTQNLSSADRKNYHPSISTFDTNRYIKSNNFVMAPMTTTHKIEHPRSMQSSLTNSVYIGQAQVSQSNGITFGINSSQQHNKLNNQNGQQGYYRYEHRKY